MTAKDCGHHHGKKNLFRRVIAISAAFIAAVLFIILLVWLILRPAKPHFILQDATVYAFNLSAGGNLLTTTLQITLSARNPNDRIGIYYDKLDVYAAYHSQQVTLPTRLPASYQGHKDITVWSPFLSGAAVPVAPYLAVSLNQDQMTGTVLINVRVDGRVRWKVGTFVSGKYHLYANCPAYINFGNTNNNAVIVGSAVKYQLIMDCNVDV